MMLFRCEVQIVLKHIFAKTVIGAALASLALGCATEAMAKNPKDIRLVYSVQQLANPWYQEAVAGMNQACEEFGIHCSVLDAQSSKEKQNADLMAAAEGGYDAILATVFDVKALSEAFGKAREKKIVTGSLGQIARNANLIYTIDEFGYGTIIGVNAAKWAKQALNCNAKVGLLTQDHIETSRVRADGVERGLRDICPNLQIVSRLYADDPFRGMMISNLMLQRDHDINMFVSNTDSGGIGAYLTLWTNNLLDDNHAVFSGDAIPDVIALMKEPKSVYRGTVDMKPREAGYESTKQLYHMIQNGAPLTPVIKVFSFKPITKEQVGTAN